MINLEQDLGREDKRNEEVWMSPSGKALAYHRQGQDLGATPAPESKDLNTRTKRNRRVNDLKQLSEENFPEVEKEVHLRFKHQES